MTQSRPNSVPTCGAAVPDGRNTVPDTRKPVPDTGEAVPDTGGPVPDTRSRGQSSNNGKTETTDEPHPRPKQCSPAERRAIPSLGSESHSRSESGLRDRDRRASTRGDGRAFRLLGPGARHRDGAARPRRVRAQRAHFSTSSADRRGARHRVRRPLDREYRKGKPIGRHVCYSAAAGLGAVSSNASASVNRSRQKARKRVLRRSLRTAKPNPSRLNISSPPSTTRLRTPTGGWRISSTHVATITKPQNSPRSGALASGAPPRTAATPAHATESRESCRPYNPTSSARSVRYSSAMAGFGIPKQTTMVSSDD